MAAGTSCQAEPCCTVRSLGRHRHQAFDGAARAVQRFLFDHFRDGEQHHDHRRFGPLAQDGGARDRHRHQGVDVQVEAAQGDEALAVGVQTSQGNGAQREGYRPERGIAIGQRHHLRRQRQHATHGELPGRGVVGVRVARPFLVVMAVLVVVFMVVVMRRMAGGRGGRRIHRADADRRQALALGRRSARAHLEARAGCRRQQLGLGNRVVLDAHRSADEVGRHVVHAVHAPQFLFHQVELGRATHAGHVQHGGFGGARCQGFVAHGLI
ncbi:hypothetical protein ACFJI0_13415 [Hydrogenophaga sp. UC242_53]|uniref:hypothetical protein n=1 Tax=Hydrogenophaga sp. UC242_53 TaxID=3350170 RepID=UPI0036D2D1F6